MIKKCNIKNKLILGLSISFILASVLSACSAQGEDLTTNQSATTSFTAETLDTTQTTKTSTSSKVSVAFDSDDLNANWVASKAILLNGSSISFSGTGAKVNGSTVTITSAGTYSLSGSLTDGQIIVNAGDTALVRLVLNGANITCSTSAPVYVKNAKKTVIILATGTENQITDGTAYVLDNKDDKEPNAAIFSKCDLTINGSGSLSIDANYKNAIHCKDELKIADGNITIDSVGDGIKGKDCVAVKNANITINAKSDGIQSTNDSDSAKGFVYIAGKTIKITSGQDAIQAQTSVLISGGNITITAGGGSANSINSSQNEFGMGYSSNKETSTVSTKGIKAAVDVTIDGGTLIINSADDAIHSNNSITVSGGKFTISSGDDGIHADTSLTISGGTIDIEKSYEGIESAAITIKGGNIHIIASDDGINVAGGNDSSSTNGRPGQNNFSSSGNYNLTISRGNITVNSSGDGIDVNGGITMTGGAVIVNGPTEDNNGALDYDTTCKVTGGYILAAGSSGMALAPDTTSTVHSVKINFTSALSAGTAVHIETEDGEDVLTFTPVKKYQSIVLCSSALKKGTTYEIYTGGSSTGTVKDGLYTGGKYTGGTKYSDFTVSSMVTNLGSSGGMGGGGGRP